MRRMVALYTVFVLLVFNVYLAEAKSLKKGEEFFEYKEGNPTGQIIRIVSSDEVEIEMRKGIFLGKYTIDDNRMRIVATALGNTMVTYYKVTSDGLVEEKTGVISYTKAILNTISKKKGVDPKKQTASFIQFLQKADFKSLFENNEYYQSQVLGITSSNPKVMHQKLIKDFYDKEEFFFNEYNVYDVSYSKKVDYWEGYRRKTFGGACANDEAEDLRELSVFFPNDVKWEILEIKEVEGTSSFCNSRPFKDYSIYVKMVYPENNTAPRDPYKENEKLKESILKLHFEINTGLFKDYYRVEKSDVYWEASSVRDKIRIAADKEAILKKDQADAETLLKTSGNRVYRFKENGLLSPEPKVFSSGQATNVKADTVAEYIEDKDGGKWVKLRLANGQEGWVLGSTLGSNIELVKKSTAEIAGEERVKNSNSRLFRVKKDGAKLQRLPKVFTSDYVAVDIKAGTMAEYLEENGRWIKCKLPDGKEGYFYDKDVEEIKNQ